MNAKEFKEKLTIEQINKIMMVLGADSKAGAKENEILYRTICHGGNSHKLYFYKDSKEFHCYSECGQLDIINVVENVLNLDFTEAKNFICRTLGIPFIDLKEGFDSDVYDEEAELLNRYNDKPKEVDMTRNFKMLDKNILNSFYKMYHPAFYNDGISIMTLHKYNIRYDILNERIIIPHYDENDNLIAIRCRNLKEELILQKKKYMPIHYNGKLLSAPTGKYLYGLNFNKDNIKRIKKVIIVESEKAVMQLDTILDGQNFGVALSSSSLSLVQVELLKELGVEEVIIALDKEFDTYGSIDEKNYAMVIRKGIINKLLPHFNVSVLWDTTNLLKRKDSPTDRGRDVFVELFRNRIFIEK